MPDGFESNLLNRAHGEFGVVGFEFLEAYDIWRRFAQPLKQTREATIDTVDVISCDLHGGAAHLVALGTSHKSAIHSAPQCKVAWRTVRPSHAKIGHAATNERRRPSGARRPASVARA